MITIVVAPGATTAGSNISLPAGAPPVEAIVSAVLFSGSDATNPAVAKTLTVVDTTPSSGQIQLVDESTVKLGDNTTTRDILIITYIETNSQPGY